MTLQTLSIGIAGAGFGISTAVQMFMFARHRTDMAFWQRFGITMLLLAIAASLV